MKKSHLLGALCAIVLAATPLSIAYGSTITVEFEVSSFSPIQGSTSAPTDSVSGTITYEAASTTLPIEDLISIDLTIDGHTYDLDEDEVGFFLESGASPVRQVIFATANSGVSANVDDFNLQWEMLALEGYSFTYASETTPGIWTSTTFDTFSVTAVPIPPALWLFGSGLLGMIGIARRKQAA